MLAIALCFVAHRKNAVGGDPPKERLPRMLRDELLALSPPIETFNPRGKSSRN